MTLFSKEEKRVEYIELIYDLIFVYIVGRNNALMHNIENGFTSGGSFFAYVFCTLAIIQIWMFSTFYINLYGRNSISFYLLICICSIIWRPRSPRTGSRISTAFA